MITPDDEFPPPEPQPGDFIQTFAGTYEVPVKPKRRGGPGRPKKQPGDPKVYKKREFSVEATGSLMIVRKSAIIRIKKQIDNLLFEIEKLGT